MSFKTYNNNSQKQPTVNVYTPISFFNSESNVSQSRLSISYFNKVMRITIALKNGENNGFATYDNDNAIEVYISSMKAKMVYDLVYNKLLKDDKVFNVCVELNQGLLKISNGVEFGSINKCISISTIDEANNVSEVVYEFKTNNSCAYNYNNSTKEFSTEIFENLEFETFMMTLDSYYQASTYAIAATVMEASMYRRQSQTDMIRKIAEKVGVEISNSNGKFKNTSSFLNNDSSNNNGMNNVPKEYESSSFEEIMENM